MDLDPAAGPERADPAAGPRSRTWSDGGLAGGARVRAVDGGLSKYFEKSKFEFRLRVVY